MKTSIIEVFDPEEKDMDQGKKLIRGSNFAQKFKVLRIASNRMRA
jgi:hypothetical protein